MEGHHSGEIHSNVSLIVLPLKVAARFIVVRLPGWWSVLWWPLQSPVTVHWKYVWKQLHVCWQHDKLHKHLSVHAGMDWWHMSAGAWWVCWCCMRTQLNMRWFDWSIPLRLHPRIYWSVIVMFWHSYRFSWWLVPLSIESLIKQSLRLTTVYKSWFWWTAKVDPFMTK